VKYERWMHVFVKLNKITWILSNVGSCQVECGVW